MTNQYEMLGGQCPFKAASTIETLHAILTTDPPDLSNGNHQVPPSLSHIVRRLLAKAPDGAISISVNCGDYRFDLALQFAECRMVPETEIMRPPGSSNSAFRRVVGGFAQFRSLQPSFSLE